MRLSKLHIAGFKSFPDRAELGFDQGVTAIVGPNGCGKSNVVDAITWVLGEQSAKSLRGERMEDVIFNGSDARKPTATAEVRLKLTDVAQAATMAPAPDLDELLDATPLITRDIEIGRRLYRSGESEYLIDGEVRRLRDVHDLLMDSGLGVKAYTVIEQGKIGQILASRPAERRMLIEEAAGVTKYKSRRRSAELKLEAAQQNLTRIDDIIFEVEKQRGALKRQAARARRYRRLREELRKWEQVQFARRHAALARDIAAADARLDDARAREAGAAAHVAELDAALETVRLGLTEAESRATAAREEAHARELEIGRRQQQIVFDRQQIDELTRQAAVYDDEIRDLDGRRAPATTLLATHRDAVLGARQLLEDAAARVADRETDYTRALGAVQEIERDADATRAAVLAAGTTLSALRQARDNAGAMRDRVAADRERLEIEARELAAEADRASRAHAAATAALAEARLMLDDARTSRTAVEATLVSSRTAREQLAHALAARERETAAKGGRLRSLEDLEASRATFGDAARYLLSLTGDRVPHHGAVADHLIVDRSYERAVDALLGDVLQHVVVSRQEDVTTALDLLGEADAGRCGFVVTSALRDRPETARGPVPEGAKALTEVVRTTGPLAATLGEVIGDALIVDSFDAARSLSSTVSVPVASLTGEVFRHAWLVQGGSRRDARGILETRAETATLREEIGASRVAIDTMRADLADRDRTLDATVAALAAIDADLHNREKAIVALDGQSARSADEHERVSRRLTVVETERARSEEEQQTAERRRDEASGAIDQHQIQQREAEDNLSGVLAKLQAAREESESRMRLVTESRTEQATLVERVSGFEAEVARLEEVGRELEARIAARRASIERTTQRRDELYLSIRDTEAKLDEDVRVLETLRAEMRDLDDRVSDLRQRFNVADQTIRGARHALDAVRGEVLQSEVARATASADLTHLAAACVDAVGATIDEVVVAVARMEDDGELRAPARSVSASTDDDDDGEVPDDTTAVAGDADASDDTPANPDEIALQLRKKIERLGPVNMMAIEQFDDLESRHIFLTTQRKDLLDAIAQTGEAIRKIDTTTKERFGEAFEVINRYFETTFSTLFGGGRAGLVLIDQENDTESGIDIIAQPPGKRLQNVQLLSGGEKALTAMALMFAVFKYRPSPFCLLDEIDAPLDDANIGRFVEMLQGMQEHTQFILITHNRKTMEIANRLYGVTMEEPGVSKLISVQLN